MKLVNYLGRYTANRMTVFMTTPPCLGSQSIITDDTEESGNHDNQVKYLMEVCDMSFACISTCCHRNVLKSKVKTKGEKNKQ